MGLGILYFWVLQHGSDCILWEALFIFWRKRANGMFITSLRLREHSGGGKGERHIGLCMDYMQLSGV
jgi:hypothetical protein